MIYIKNYNNKVLLNKISDLYKMRKIAINIVCLPASIVIQLNNSRIIHIKWPINIRYKKVKKLIEKQVSLGKEKNNFYIVNKIFMSLY